MEESSKEKSIHKEALQIPKTDTWIINLSNKENPKDYVEQKTGLNKTELSVLEKKEFLSVFPAKVEKIFGRNLSKIKTNKHDLDPKQDWLARAVSIQVDAETLMKTEKKTVYQAIEIFNGKSGVSFFKHPMLAGNEHILLARKAAEDHPVAWPTNPTTIELLFI